MPCQYIIHTVGPVWKDGNHHEDELLANCYKNSLNVAVENHIRTIAFPSISTGVYGFPLERAAKIAIHTVSGFLRENFGQIDRVIWVLFDDETERIYQAAAELFLTSLS